MQPQIDLVDVGVGADPYSPPPPGHQQHFHPHHSHHPPHPHHNPHQMGLIPSGIPGHSHQHPSAYQDWSWPPDSCD
ncbi:uncharacterized protein LOC127289730 [Leptopilina boulardi]|uniref:uncharacterized protein LOC127289730 n=1 Tax=Leptopilina boulardi TaxID=63433 RepID=UPI0021F52482|nr:uncharacterized protein LOC127289730 [Leptopilina boulardi]